MAALQRLPLQWARYPFSLHANLQRRLDARFNIKLTNHQKTL
jgi:hypothetical protein